MTYRQRSLFVLASVCLILLLLGGFVYIRDNPTELANPDNREQVARGAVLYLDHCADCHGAVLEGEANWRTPNPDGTMKAPPHDYTGHTWHHSDDLLFDYIKYGGSHLVPKGFQSAMPGFEKQMTDRDIWAVLAFIKSYWTERQYENQKRVTLQQRS